MRIATITTGGRAARAAAEFDRFVGDSGDALLRTAYLIVGDLDEAEDLVQECLIAVARRWPRVRSMDHPRAYARRILVNLALDGARTRTRRRAELDQQPLTADAEQRIDESELRYERSELIDALALLAPRQRAVLVLRYLEDLSEAQVAAALGCSVGTVKSTTSRALARLQATLTADPPLTPKE